MKQLRTVLFSLGLSICMAGAASAQGIITDKGKSSDAVMVKLHKIDLLNQILPLLLTKKQILNDILPALDKARAQWKVILDAEDNTLAELDPKADEVITNAVDKRIYPPKDYLLLVSGKTKQMLIKRQIAQADIVKTFLGVLTTSLNAGQMKALEGSYDAHFIDPTKKPEEISVDTKRDFFVRNVFLDPMTAELLAEIVAKMPDDPPPADPAAGAGAGGGPAGG